VSGTGVKTWQYRVICIDHPGYSNSHENSFLSICLRFTNEQTRTPPIIAMVVAKVVSPDTARSPEMLPTYIMVSKSYLKKLNDRSVGRASGLNSFSVGSILFSRCVQIVPRSRIRVGLTSGHRFQAFADSSTRGMMFFCAAARETCQASARVHSEFSSSDRNEQNVPRLSGGGFALNGRARQPSLEPDGSSLVAQACNL
jgi:hypothetical protein